MARAPSATIPDPPHHPIPVENVVIEIRTDPDNPGARLVLQDGVESSYIDIARPDRLGFEYQRHLAGVIDVHHPRRLPTRVLQIGGGPCAVLRYLVATRRQCRATVVEIDQGVIDVAEQYLGLAAGPQLAVRVAEGRAYLDAWADDSMDVVIVDAFAGVVVPHRLVTRQCMARIHDSVLAPEGLQIINLIDIPPLGFARAVVATAQSEYAHVVVIAEENAFAGETSGNFVVAASDRPLDSDVIIRRSSHDATPWKVVTGRALGRWVGDGAPLDDDVAPDHDLARLGELFGRVRRRLGDAQ